jgi:hypothetical protein
MPRRPRTPLRITAYAALPVAVAALIGAARYVSGDGAPGAAPAPHPVTTASAVPTAPTAPAVPGRADSPQRHPTSAAAAPAVTPPAPTARTPASRDPAPLAPARLPDAARSAWTSMGPSHTRTAGPSVAVDECASVRGAATWQQQGYVSTYDTPAVQDTFAFATEAGAKAAWTRLVAGLDGCRATSRALQSRNGLPQDATVTRTAATADGAAYARTWTAVPGMSAPGRQTDHVYAVREGAVLSVLQVTEISGTTAPGTAYSPGQDAAELAVLAGRG